MSESLTAAKRAAEELTALRRKVTTSEVASLILAEFAPLLAAKDAEYKTAWQEVVARGEEIERLHRQREETGKLCTWAHNRIAELEKQVAEWTKSTLDGIRDYIKLREEHSKWLEAIQRTDDLEQQVAELRICLRELQAMVWGECPSLLDEDSGGSAYLDIKEGE